MRLDDEKFGEMSPYGVRLPRELKAKIKAAAKANRHSMNAEIVERLEASFRIIESQVIRQALPNPEDKDEVYRRVMMQLNSLSELVERIKDQKE